MDRYRLYDIQAYIKKVENLDWLDIIDYSNKEVSRCEGLLRRMKRNDPDEYTIRKYYDFVHESSYFFTMGGVPAAMAKNDFQRLKPVIENLVAKGQWKANALESFQ